MKHLSILTTLGLKESQRDEEELEHFPCIVHRDLALPSFLG